MEVDRKLHWDKVYETKQPEERSWTQPIPQTSLDFIHSLRLPKSCKIIDVGGGDSNLVDFLLDEGYHDITIADISSGAIEKAKQRLGGRAEKVKWIITDITSFDPPSSYDLWHDRAAFHFLTTPEQISAYVDIAGRAVRGYMILSTFSTSGPKKCSGLEVTQYDEESLTLRFNEKFEKIRCIAEDHQTPFHTKQNFIYCCFKKR